MDIKLKLRDGIKDRGEISKICLENEKLIHKENFEGRGDSKTLEVNLHLGERDYPVTNDAELSNSTKKCRPAQTCPLVRDGNVRLMSNLAGRRSLAERYTIRKYRNSGNVSRDEDKAKFEAKIADGALLLPNQEVIKLPPKLDIDTNISKKLVSKVMSKDDSGKSVRAVTFGQNKTEPMIKSGACKRKQSKANTKKSGNRRIRTQKPPRFLSTLSPTRGLPSPPTEVAKWAPASIDNHTKPYYEAWVNPRLVGTNEEKCAGGKSIYNTLKVLQRAPSPELVYGDITDERFTGRIRIHV